MRHPTLPLRAYIDRLRALYGRPKRPIPSGPFEWIIWEHVAAAPDDEQRALVFRTLRQKIGTTPQAILRTPKPKMLELLAPGGPNGGARLAKLHEAAELMIEIGLARVRTLVRTRARPISIISSAASCSLANRAPPFGPPGARSSSIFGFGVRRIAWGVVPIFWRSVRKTRARCSSSGAAATCSQMIHSKGPLGMGRLGRP